MPFFYTIVVLCILRLGFQIGAAFVGYRNGLWDGSGYPTSGNIATSGYFYCVEQIEGAISRNIEFQSMARSFGYELLFSFIAMGFIFWIMNLTMKQRYQIASGTETNYGKQLSLIIRNDRYIFVVIWISVATLIFFVDFFRYAATSILTTQKTAFTWSSFCIAGPYATALDKVGSYFESLYIGFAYVMLLVAQSRQSLPAVDLDHGDGQCGLKAYLKYWKIVLMSLSAAILGFCLVWSIYINIIAVHPQDLWYMVTPLFSIILVSVLYLSILDRANEISFVYEKNRKVRENEIRRRYTNREEVMSHMSSLPKNPIEEQFGDNWILRLIKGYPIFFPVAALLAALVNDKTISFAGSSLGLF